MTYTYTPSNMVCSVFYEFDIEDGIINDLKVKGGCNGNLQGISSLVKGMKVEDVIEKLEGIRCGLKPTSCPDQISKALKSYLEQNA